MGEFDKDARFYFCLAIFEGAVLSRYLIPLFESGTKGGIGE